MKAWGALFASILIGIFAIWLVVQLLGVALKLVALLIGIALAVIAYLVIERMIRERGR
jgi:uncharacterized membrane protein YraQ (UPF0718 family)